MLNIAPMGLVLGKHLKSFCAAMVPNHAMTFVDLYPRRGDSYILPPWEGNLVKHIVWSGGIPGNEVDEWDVQA